MEYASADAAYMSKIGSASISAGSAAANQIAPSEFNTLLKKLDGLHEQACRVKGVAEGIADRLFGPLPECASVGEPCAPVFGQLGQVNEAIESISRILSVASAAQERLNRL